MFIGHFAVGFAAKRVAPRSSLGVLIAAPIFLDLPLYPGSSTLVGLGLWHSVLGTVVVEGAMFVAAVWAYASFTRPRDGVGRYALWALVLLLAVLYVSDLRSPPPPDV